MAAVSTIARAYACEACPQGSPDLHVPQRVCPVSAMWPAIVKWVCAGGPLFTLWAGEEVLQEMRAVARAREWVRAEEPVAISLRRGAVRAILEAGGAFAQLPKSGR